MGGLVNGTDDAVQEQPQAFIKPPTSSLVMPPWTPFPLSSFLVVAFAVFVQQTGYMRRVIFHCILATDYAFAKRRTLSETPTRR